MAYPDEQRAKADSSASLRNDKQMLRNDKQMGLQQFRNCSIYAFTVALLFCSFLIASAQQVPLAPAPKITALPPSKPVQLQTVPAAPVLPDRAQHEANFETESQQANALYVAGKRLEALPLYADLCRQDPTVALFAERHALGLSAKSTAPGTDKKEQFNAFIQALSEMYRARSLGDDSPELRIALMAAEKTSIGAYLNGIPLTVGYTYLGTPEAQTLIKQGEVAFAEKKFDESAKLYIAAAVQDPKYYVAALYSGDAYFRSKDYSDAGIWYAKAIAIDPDRETAYRYWADALFRAGDPMGAKKQAIQAFIAEPYSVATWTELRQWAAATKTLIGVPTVNRKEYRLRDGRIALDPAIVPETGDGHSAWFVYQQVRVKHGATSMVQNIPPAGSLQANGDFLPSGYIHTLDEEVDALTQTIADIDKKLAAGTLTYDKLDPSFKTLQQLQKDHMLECFILLNSADLGLHREYAKYRAEHRDLLSAYVDRYLLVRSAVAMQSTQSTAR